MIRVNANATDLNHQNLTAAHFELPENLNLVDNWPVIYLGEAHYSEGNHMASLPVWGTDLDQIIENFLSQENTHYEFIFLEKEIFEEKNHKLVYCYIYAIPLEV